MHLRLTRFRQDDKGTFGVLMVPAIGVFATVEAPWVPSGADSDWGLKGQSCLPAGEYKLIWHRSPKYGDRFHIVDCDDDGKGVTLHEQENCARSHCLIHPANWARELQGCIALGTSYAPVNPSGTPMITSSRAAISALESGVKPEFPHTLSIDHAAVEPWQ